MTGLRHRIKRATGVVALAGATATAGCAPAISTQDEMQLGQETAAQLNQELPLVRDVAVLQYINQLGNSIAQRADSRGVNYTFYIVNAPEVNAFAVPGGHVYVNRGLIERTRNLSELAGVLAHEVGHVVHRHGIEQWQRAQNANLGLSVLYGVLLGRNPSGVEQAAIQVGGAGVFSGYSRDAEREADATAIQYMMSAGIHPQGLVSMFETLMAERQQNPGSVAGWFSTHPTTTERIESTRAAIAQIPASSLRGLSTDTQAYSDFRSRVSRLPAAATR